MEIIVKPTQVNGIGPCGRFFWIGRESETVATIFETTRPVSAKSWLRARGKVERCSEVCKVHRLGEVNTPDNQSCKSVNFHTKVFKPSPVVPLASIICAVSWEDRNIWEHWLSQPNPTFTFKGCHFVSAVYVVDGTERIGWTCERRFSVIIHFIKWMTRLYSLSDIVRHSCQALSGSVHFTFHRIRQNLGHTSHQVYL